MNNDISIWGFRYVLFFSNFATLYLNSIYLDFFYYKIQKSNSKQYCWIIVRIKEMVSVWGAVSHVAFSEP